MRPASAKGRPRAGWANHLVKGPSHQPAYPQADREILRLEEDGRPFHKIRWCGIDRPHFMAQFFGAACNLLRMAKIAASETVKPPETVATA